MKNPDNIGKVYCHIHQAYCDSPVETRRSIFGAVVSACYQAWNEPFVIQGSHLTGETRTLPRIDLRNWPEIL
jgi:hypothetical protein